MQGIKEKKRVKFWLVVVWVCLSLGAIGMDVYAQEGGNFYFKLDKGTSPVVVLDAPYGRDHTWTTVLGDELRKTDKVRVFQYDRAGLGMSEASKNSRTPVNKAQELHLLLAEQGITKFYYVGYALSDFTIREYAYLYPGEVMGTMWLDCVGEDEISEIDSFLGSVNKSLAKKFRDSFTKEDGTFTDLKTGIEQINKIKKFDSLRNIPLYVISGNYHGFSEILRTYNMDESKGPEMEKKWNMWQDNLASLSDNSTHLTVDVYSHFRKKTEVKCVLKMLGLDVDENNYIDEHLFFSEGVSIRNLPLFRFFAFTTDGLGW